MLRFARILANMVNKLGQAEWNDKICKQLCRVMQEHLSTVLPPIEGIKLVKINPPDTFDGTSDIDVFKQWLVRVLNWLIVN